MVFGNMVMEWVVMVQFSVIIEVMFLVLFHLNLEMPSSVAEEVMAVIKVIQLVWVRDWNHIWLEVNSSCILDFLYSPSLVPWSFHFEWHNCMFVPSLSYKCSLFSHISGRYSSCQCIVEFWYYFGLGLMGLGYSFYS